jgi:hypothetical protein
MSGSLEDLFGEDEDTTNNEKDIELPAHNQNRASRRVPTEEVHQVFEIHEVNPGAMDLLPTRMPVFQERAGSKARSAISRADSVVSEDGQVLPPLRNNSTPGSRRPTMTEAQKEPSQRPKSQTPTANPGPAEGQMSGCQFQVQQQEPVQSVLSAAGSQSRPASRMMVRTASMGSLTLPTIPASDPILPPSSLQRSQTWSEVQHLANEAPMPPMPQMPDNTNSNTAPSNRTISSKKALIKQKLELAVANGEMPPFCSNCGAIQTSTWRKAWAQELKGEPGYYEYSDEPGRVTAIIVLTRDDQGKPTSYQLIKKFLLPEESQDDFKEFLLCNRKCS